MEEKEVTPAPVVKKRKTSPRPCAGFAKKPGVAEFKRRQWADPVYRAAMAAKAAERKALGKPKATRLGVPDGMRKFDAEELWENARKSAKRTMTKLKAAGVITTTEEKAEEALEAAITVLRAPGNQTTKLQAARLVLDFTKSKPASKSEISVNKAEEWLTKVATESNDADEGAATNDTPKTV